MLRLVADVSRSWIMDKWKTIAWHYARQLPFPLGPRQLSVRVRPPFGDSNYRLRFEAPVDTLRALTMFSPANPWTDLDLLPNPALIIDLGANNGYSSLYWQARFPTAKICGIEMDGHNFSQCCNLFTDNGLEPHFFHCAITSQDEMVTYQPHAEPGQHRLAQLCDAQFMSQNQPVEVPGLRLTSFLDRNGFGEIDLLKVDIEGAEQLLLETVAQWKPRVRQMLLEVHHNVDLGWARSCLEAAGFEIVGGDTHSRTEWFCVHRPV